MKDISNLFFEDVKQNVPDVCKVGTFHKSDFDEVMFTIQISIGNCEIMDVLLDGESRINIIFEHMWRKLRLKKTQSMLFMVRMANKKKGTTNRVDTKPQN
jgi:uncharacterized protein (DUF1786 family)